MTAASISLLDQAELIQLALNSSKNSDSGAALSYLKEAVSRTDATATAHFLLGAEYAQIQMYDRAVSEMESAVALDPSLFIARFQLGLLLLSSGDAKRALDILEPLNELGGANPLRHFGLGLIHLMRDEFSDALRCLTLGIELNLENQPLNNDMQKIIAEINKLPANSVKNAEAVSSLDESSTQHIFISAYTGNDSN